MDVARLCRVLLVFIGSLAFFLTPIAIYFAMYPIVMNAMSRGDAAEASRYAVTMFLYQQCVSASLATIVPALWASLCPKNWFRVKEALIRTLVVIASALSIVQTIYLAASVMAPRMVREALASRVLSTLIENPDKGLSYASILATLVGALCATPSAVVGAACFGVWISSRNALSHIFRCVIALLCAVMVLRTVVALLIPLATPLMNTLAILISLVLAILELLRKSV